MKKGYISPSQKLLVWVTLIGPTIFVISFYLYNIGETYQDNHFPYPEALEDRVIESRILYNTGCLALTSEQGRVKPGIIDLDRSKDTLDECIQSDEPIHLQVRVRNGNNVVKEFTTDSWKDALPTNPHETTYTLTYRDPESDSLKTGLVEFRYK